MDRVADGREAIAYVKQQDAYRDRPRPTLILLDLKLPRTDGFGVLRTLKSDDQLKSIPVVVLTTSDAAKDVVKAYHLHVNSYLVKPANFAKFRELIAAVTSYWGHGTSRPLQRIARFHRQLTDIAHRSCWTACAKQLSFAVLHAAQKKRPFRRTSIDNQFGGRRGAASLRRLRS